MSAIRTTPIEIPSAWRLLLELPSIPESAPKAGKVGVDDENAYVDDARVVCSQVTDRITIRARLFSGSTNYWLEWDMQDSASKSTKPLEYDEGGNVCPSDVIRLASPGDEVSFEVPVKTT